MGVLDHVPRTLEEVAPVWRWVGAGALAVTGYVIVSQVHYSLWKVRSRRQRAAFRKKNDKHKQEFAARIRKIQPGDSHEAICAMSVMALREALQKGSLKPSQVLRAYQRKAVDVNEKINCVADYILEAEEMAEKLDNATEKGSLYGIPFSVKEIHPLKGYVATFGNYTYDYVAPVTMLALQTLISQGAIPFVRSNVPYMAWSYMGLNPLYGDHGNPHDPTRNPGGSSGGQAAMVAAGATPIALGCDLAGSVRNPAAWCGIVGLKCGSTRISKKGFACDPGGLKDVLATAYGPMARDVDSVVFMMRHLLVDQMYQADRSVPPLGWRQHIYEDRKPLRIGYYINNGACRAVPAAERAVKIAKEKLEAAGHTLVPFDLPETDGSLGRSWLNPDMYYSLFMGDGGVHWRSDLGYDAPGRELVVPNLPFPRLPLWFNYFCGHLIKLFNEERGWFTQAMCKSSTVAKWWDHLTVLHNWRELCLAKLEEHQIDVVLSPAMSTPAMPLKLNQPNGAFASYSYVYNLLDWPAGVVPVTKVTVSDVADMKNYPSDGPVYSLIQQGMQDSDGLPVNVQIAAPPFSEELIFRVLKQIEEAV